LNKLGTLQKPATVPLAEALSAVGYQTDSAIEVGKLKISCSYYLQQK